jgi:PAS domain S-box-containing protein
VRKDGTPRAVSDRHYYSMFEYAGVGVANVSFAGELVDMNARFCEMLGYTREELPKRIFQQLTHPDDLDANLDLLTKVRQGEIDGYRIERRYRRANNEILWAELTASIEKDNDGHQCGLISTIQDISQRRQNEERLNFLMGEVAHRSKNMLAIVRAMARQIAHNATSVQDFQKALDLRIAGMGESYDLSFQSADNRTSLDRLIGSQLALAIGRQRFQLACAVIRIAAFETGAVHHGQALRCQRLQPANGGRGRWCQRGGVKAFFRRNGCLDNAFTPDGRTITQLGEEIAGEQSLGRFLEDQAGFPGMGNMRGVEIAYALAAEVQHLSICKRARWPVGQIVQRHHAGDHAMGDLRFRGHGQPLIHRTAFIGFDMAEGNPAQPLQRQNAGRGL